MDAAWPDLEEAAVRYDVERSALRAHIEALSPDTPPGQLRLTELVVALGCAHGNEDALRAFEQDALASTTAALRRLHDDPAFIDEVQQRVRERLLVAVPPAKPRIADYAGRGSLAGWVTVTAVRTGMNLLRKHARTRHIPEQRWAAAIALPDTGDEELEFLKRRYRETFAAALVRAAKALPERDRSVLKLSFAENLSIDRIGAVYGVHRATVARWITKAKDQLLEGMRRTLEQEDGIPPEEMSSLQRLVRSQLETSLRGLFS